MAYNYGYYPYGQYNQFQQYQQGFQQPNNSGVVRVQSEQEARTYPVGAGNSLIFLDDNAPYCYVKTADGSQLDRPRFDKYKLVKVQDDATGANSGFSSSGDKSIAYATKAEIEALERRIKDLEEKQNE